MSRTRCPDHEWSKKPWSRVTCIACRQMFEQYYGFSLDEYHLASTPPGEHGEFKRVKDDDHLE